MVDGPGEAHKTVAKGTIWNLVGSLALKLVSFVYTVIIARIFLQSDLDAFFIALSVVGTITIFSDLGVASAFSRYVPYYCGKGENKKAYTLLRASYLFSGIASIVIAALLLLFADTIGQLYQNPVLGRAIQFLSTYLIALTFLSLNSAFILGRKKAAEFNLLQNGQNALKLLLTLIMIWILGATINALAIAFTLSFAIMSVVSCWSVKKEIEVLGLKKYATGLKEQVSAIKEVVPFGITLSIVVALWAIISYTDKLMIGYFMPSKTDYGPVAIYSMATALAIMVAVFAATINNIFLPILSELHGKKDKKGMLRISSTAVRWTVLLSTPLAIVLLAFPENIMGIIFGDNYVKGATVLVIFTIGIFVRVLSNVHASILAALRLVRIELYVAAAAAALNFLLNLLLIPQYGIEGAAVASAISFLIVTVLMVYYSKKMFGFGFPKDIYKPLIAGFIGLMVILALKGWAVQLIDSFGFGPAETNVEGALLQKLAKMLIAGALFALACLVYIAALIVMKALGKEEIELLGAGLRKARLSEARVQYVKDLLE
ncbi:MAG: flippase [Thaumarchaeota archaeon]|nr:flippase [Nitrososphaerota archaeon]